MAPGLKSVEKWLEKKKIVKGWQILYNDFVMSLCLLYNNMMNCVSNQIDYKIKLMQPTFW